MYQLLLYSKHNIYSYIHLVVIYVYLYTFVGYCVKFLIAIDLCQP